jgi:hypothetical protein
MYKTDYVVLHKQHKMVLYLLKQHLQNSTGIDTWLNTLTLN